MTETEKIFLLIAMYQPEKRYSRLIREGNKMQYPLLQGKLEGYKLGSIDLSESLKSMEQAPISMIKMCADQVINKYRKKGYELLTIELEGETKPLRVSIPI